MPDQLRITYSKSAIGRIFKQKRVISALGFTHLGQSRVVADSPSMRGMIRKVEHLLVVEPVSVSVDAPKSKVSPKKVAEPVVKETEPEVTEEKAEEASETEVKEEKPSEAENNQDG